MSLFNEFKRRNVHRVGLAYLAGSWLLIQITETIFPLFGFEDSASRLVIVVLGIGLVPALLFSWVFELTPEGLKKESEIDPSRSITRTTGKKIDRVIMVVLVLALGYFSFDKFVLDPIRDRQMAETVAKQARTDARVEFFGDKSVAVLPFVNISEDSDHESFTNGIHDDLVTHLTKIGSIKTISRYSISQYRATTKAIAQIAQELDVATILQGGVQHAGDQVRINVQLIDAASETFLWAETYDRQLTVANIFAIQSEIAASIAGALNLVLSKQEVDQLDQVPTNNLEAYNAYLTGTEIFGRPGGSLQKLKTAQRMFERAVELDPEFAAAWAKLSLCHSSMYWFGYDRTEMRREQSWEALARARALKPELPEAYIAAGYYYYHSFRNYEKALQEFARAERLLPGDVQLMAAQGYIQRRLGQWNESLGNLERAIALDPRNAGLIQSQASTFERLGRYEEAVRYFDKALMLAPDSSIVMFKRAFTVFNASGDTSALRDFILHNPGSLEGPTDYMKWLVEFLDGNYEASLDALKNWKLDVFAYQIKFFPRSLLEGLSQQYIGDERAARLAYESALAYLQSEAPLPSNEPRMMIAYGMAHAGLGGLLAGALGVLGRYFQILVWPWPLSADHSFSQITPAGPGKFHQAVGTDHQRLHRVTQQVAHAA